MKKTELDEIVSDLDISSAEKRESRSRLIPRIAAAAAVLIAVAGITFVMPAIYSNNMTPPDTAVETKNGAVTDGIPRETANGVKDQIEYITDEPRQIAGFVHSYGIFEKSDAVYPKTVYVSEKNEEYYSHLRERTSHYGRGSDLSRFFNGLAAAVKTQSEEKNLVISPLNVYMALAIEAEISEGETQAQIFDVLGVDSLDALRDKTENIWLAHYCDDGSFRCLLADSIWLDSDRSIEYNEEKIETLRNRYFTSVFRGDLQSDDFVNAYRSWLNDQTDGRLKDIVDKIDTDENTAMILASTIDFCAKWDGGYTTVTGLFKNGNKVKKCDFLKSELYGADIFFGDGYTAYMKQLENSAGKMWYILPDEDKTVDEIFSSFDMMNFTYSLKRVSDVHLTAKVPKLDVSQQTDLIPALSSMGITKCFEPSYDFSPVAVSDERIFVGKAIHGARIITNEKGVVGTAFTHFSHDAYAADVKYKDYEFTADRPFIFVILSDDRLPLFFGIVNEP